VKALRMTEDEFAAARKRIGASQQAAPKDEMYSPAANKNAHAATHKFHTQRTNGYASKREARRAHELELMQKAGEISDLCSQVPFVLIGPQRDESGVLRERAIVYRADFVYTRAGKMVVEDVKGLRKGSAWENYVLKRKLMLSELGIAVLEVGRQR
jgi:Protein of unknown function (DUF1064)